MLSFARVQLNARGIFGKCLRAAFNMASLKLLMMTFGGWAIASASARARTTCVSLPVSGLSSITTPIRNRLSNMHASAKEGTHSLAYSANPHPAGNCDNCNAVLFLTEMFLPPHLRKDASCDSTAARSADKRMSISTHDKPASRARRIPARVFSGACAASPRCPMRRESLIMRK